MARLRHVGILLLGLAPWVLGACALLPVTKNAALPAPLKPTPGPGVREVRNSEGQVTVREEYLVDEAGKVWRHGTEWTFWPDGTLKSERNFDHSEPVGEWKTYWPDGSLRSDYRIDPWQPTRMVYYHPGGAKASEGLAQAGRREGPWTYWYSNGVVSEEGPYAEGERNGVWRTYDEAGRLLSEGTYAFGAKVGSWTYSDSPSASPARD